MAAIRDFVQDCIASGLMEVVDNPIRCDQIAALVAKEERGKNRALLFNNLTDSGARVVSNLFGSRKRICRATSAKSLTQLYTRFDAACADGESIGLHSGSRVPAGYTTIEQPDLAEVIPLIRYSQEDAGPYLTGAVVLVEDPNRDGFHLCFVRMAFIGGNKLIFNAATPRISKIVASTVGQGQALDLTILIGAPPAIILTAAMSMPRGVDKLKVALAMACGGVELVGDRPATFAFPSEFVLKAQVIPEYTSEGPFGDLKGLYSCKDRNPICLVEKAIYRHQPLFHSVSAGTSNEHFWLVTMGVRYALEKMKQRHADLLRYTLPAFGVGRIAFLVMRQGRPREEIVAELWKIPITRTFVFVNRDVKTRSAADILWAVTQRARDAADFIFGPTRHPVFQERKLVIDATVPDLAVWDNRRISVYRPR